MNTLEFTARSAEGYTECVDIPIQRVANCGMAARSVSEEELEQMFSTLEEIGVNKPDRLPMIAPKPAHLQTTKSEITVNSTTTGGELEFVLLPTEEQIYVTVGVDHKDDWTTDKNLHRANSTCPSVLAPEVWKLEDIRNHWDSLEIRCWTGKKMDHELYQQTTVASFLHPTKLLERVQSKISAPMPGTAIWSGTVSTERGGSVDARPDISSGDFYTMQLVDPYLNRRITHQYDVMLNDWVKGCKLP